MRSAAQLKGLIRNLAKQWNVETEILLRNYMLERFLERVAESKYQHHFILKGGMLISAMVGIATRTTMDLDATIHGLNLSEGEISTLILAILAIPLDDGVVFTFQGFEEIREEADYPGYRVTLEAKFEKIRQILKIDITTGDVLTPKEIVYQYKLVFDDRSIHIMAYNVETVLAEKIETIMTRGVMTTRMRDFYDVYILMRTQPVDFGTFTEALAKTAEQRQTGERLSRDFDVTLARIRNSKILIDQWQRYQRKYAYAAGISWAMVMDALTALVEPAVKTNH